MVETLLALWRRRKHTECIFYCVPRGVSVETLSPSSNARAFLDGGNVNRFKTYIFVRNVCE